MKEKLYTEKEECPVCRSRLMRQIGKIRMNSKSPYNKLFACSRCGVVKVVL